MGISGFFCFAALLCQAATQPFPPEITQGPEDLKVAMGYDAVMRCRAVGDPRPVIRWTKNDVDVTGEKYNITADGDLVVRGVFFSDAARYQCHAKNNLGEKLANGQLFVTRRTVIINDPEDYEAEAGSAATFRCDAISDHQLDLSITWLRDGTSIDFAEKPRFSMLNDNSLLIVNTTALDSGEYTCVARTEADEARAQAKLTVQDKPNPPNLDGIECGRKMATLRWHAMGDNRAPIQRYSVQYSTSFEPDTWEYATETVPAINTNWAVHLAPWANYTFRVVAWNRVGPSAPSGLSAVCRSQPDVPYKNPDHVRGEGTAPDNMLISWAKMPQIEHNGPDFHYLVEWKRDLPDETWSRFPVSWQTTEHLVLNTPTFQPYRIKVTAVNAKGPSNVAPRMVTGYSGEGTPQLAPANFTLQRIVTGTTALFTWEAVPPQSVQGHFKGYKLQTWTNDEEGQMKEIIFRNETLEGLVEIFKPFTKNYARILAYNGLFNGPPSDTLTFVTPEDKPGPVKSFQAYPIGSSAMLLKWEKPDNENGVLTSYRVYYQKITNTVLGPQLERVKINAKFHSAKLAGLEPNTKYRIEIRAETNAGEGEKYFLEQSTKSAVTAKPDTPLFLVQMTRSTFEKTPRVLVRWLPSLDGHAGTHFVVWYKLKGNGDWSQTKEVIDEDFVFLTGLEAGREYEFKMTAYDGEFSTTSKVVHGGLYQNMHPLKP